jgi:regulator of ribonuclease activity A
MKATTDLYDELGEELQSVSLQFQSYGGRASFSGPIRTVKCLEDNSMLRAVVSTPGDGAVLVVDGAGSLERAVMGDQIAAIASGNGWAGVIIHGAVRDKNALAEIDLGIKALGTNPRKSTKLDLGVADIDIAFGGVVFRVGKMLWSDDDGILVER